MSSLYCCIYMVYEIKDDRLSGNHIGKLSLKVLRKKLNVEFISVPRESRRGQLYNFPPNIT